MSWFSFGRNWAARKAAKQQLLAQLVVARRLGGAGVSVETDDTPEGEVLKVALQELLTEHTELTVELWRGKPMLCRRVDAEGAVSPAMAEHLKRSGFLAGAGDAIIAVDPFDVTHGARKADESK